MANYIHVNSPSYTQRGNDRHAHNTKSENIHLFLKEHYPDVNRQGGVVYTGKAQLPKVDLSEDYAYAVFDGTVDCHLFGEHIFIGAWDTYLREEGPLDKKGRPTFLPQPRYERVDTVPVTIEVIGEAFTKEILHEEWNEVNRKWVQSTSLHTYNLTDDEGNATIQVPMAYLNLRFSAAAAESQDGTFAFCQPWSGVAVLDPDGGPEVTVTSNFYGMTRTWKESLLFKVVITRTLRPTSPYSYYGNNPSYYDLKSVHDPMPSMQRHLKKSILTDGKDAWWDRFFKINPDLANLAVDPDKGLAAIFKKKDIKANMERLAADDPTGFAFFQWLRDGRTKEKRCNNNLLVAMLNTVGTDFDKLKAALRDARNEAFTEDGIDGVSSYRASENWQADKSNSQDFWFGTRRRICLSLPGSKERNDDLAAKADWSKQKDLGKQADGLGVDEGKFPLLRKAIVEGKIPTAIFRQPNMSPVNMEFPIWEKSLARPGWDKVIYEITADAGRRGTYDRDVTPYLAFLFRIEKYLDRHAPGSNKKSWKAMPTYVESQWALEMDDDAGTGTIKRRSAFTPVADNDTLVITVPYVAVCVSGVRTQWCYSQYYHVFEEGMTDPESGGIVVNDYEEKLNGRDDYGLCYYTLTGTDTARGYPTLLIIFERLRSHVEIQPQAGTKKVPGLVGYGIQEKTRVHFHRVRPCRSKDGIITPACKLVEACYQFMAGNVPATDIAAQQGDLMFIQCTNDPIKAGAKVAAEVQEGRALEFESHKFLPLGENGFMRLYESEAKQPANRLGFLWAPNGLKVEHPEHENIPALAEGWWEIRRAKSWEANPKAIWSRTID